MTGLPAIGTIGLGRRIVNGLSLDPSPPAMTTAFIEASLVIRYVAEMWDGVALATPSKLYNKD